MEHYVGLDVSLKLTAICIVDRTGKIERGRKLFLPILRRSRYSSDGVVLRYACLHAVTGGPDDRPLCHALWLQTLVIFPSHTYGLTDRRTDATTGVEGRRL